MSLNMVEFKDYFESNSTNYGADIAKIRSQSFERFCATGFPNRKTTNWKHSGVVKWKINNFNTSVDDNLKNISDKNKSLIKKADILVINGIVKVKSKIVGIELYSLLSLQQQDEKLLSRFMQQSYNDKNFENCFADYALASWQDGFFINITSNIIADTTLNILHVNTNDSFKNSFNIINIESHVRIKLIENTISVDDSSSWSNCLQYINLNSNSHLEYNKINQSNANSICLSSKIVKLSSDASFKYRQNNFGAKVVRDEVMLNFNGRDSSAEFTGVSLAKESSCHNTVLHINHNSDNCTSKQKFRAIVADNAEHSFQGQINVMRGVKSSVAHQDSKSILLGSNSKSNASPFLEIYADDLVCSHSATIGVLEESDLFYITSRGIDLTIARYILLRSFISDVIHESLGIDLVLILQSIVKNICDNILFEQKEYC